MRIRPAIAVLICAFAWPAAAEDDAGEEDAARAAAAEEAQEEARADPDAAPPPAPAREVFVPTEEISEDVEVPFPVDI